MGRVLATSLNVRSGPGTGYAKVASLKQNAVVTVLGASGDWYKISTGSTTGYVLGVYLKLESVSYTHLDVYKRQICKRRNHCGIRRKRNS